jgi:hypothetical protein
MATGATLAGAARRLLVKAIAPRRYPARYGPATDLALFALLRSHRYSLILGADPHGIALADTLNRRVRRPLGYVSFEVLPPQEAASPGVQALKSREQAACRNVSLLLIQDAERESLFHRSVECAPAHTAHVPVSPPPQEVPRTDTLREKLGIPAERKIVLYSGGAHGHTCMAQFEEMVSYWPEEYCLVLHCYNWKRREQCPRFVQRLLDRKRAYLSTGTAARRGGSTGSA